jgi:hypothetical protein
MHITYKENIIRVVASFSITISMLNHTQGNSVRNNPLYQGCTQAEIIKPGKNTRIILY